MFMVYKKQRLLKSFSKQWVKYNFKNNHEQLGLTETMLSQCQADYISNPNNPLISRRYFSPLEKYNKLLQFQHNFWKQRAKTNFLLNNDKNTKFFQNVVKIRTFKQKLTKFQSLDGFMFYDHKDIQTHITTDLQKRFCPLTNTNTIIMDLSVIPHIVTIRTMTYSFNHLLRKLKM